MEATSILKLALRAAAAVGVVRGPDMTWQHGVVVEE
jgi:hypothetical protein